MRIVLCNLFVIAFFFNQNACFSQEREVSVNTILFKAQQVFERTAKYNVDVNYKMFGSYKATIPLEAFSGKLINNTQSTYLKISNTIFLTNKLNKISVKIFNEERIMEVAKQPDVNMVENSPVNINNFIKLFKNKKIEDKGDYYLCTLTADYITQIPYGKVEIYIQKKDHIITKQVLYFLSKVPYKDHNGTQQEDNPRLEVTLNNFKKSISKKEEKLTNVSQYLTKYKGEFKPSITYKDFKIIQN